MACGKARDEDGPQREKRKELNSPMASGCAHAWGDPPGCKIRSPVRGNRAQGPVQKVATVQRRSP